MYRGMGSAKVKEPPGRAVFLPSVRLKIAPMSGFILFMVLLPSSAVQPL